MPIHKLTAEFVINTPLFMSGADQQKAELRVSSIKGAIRFWWRALNYAKYDGNITAMKADEDRLFGSTKGQSQVLFSLTESKITTIQAGDTFDIAREGLGLRYLGYGVMEAFDGKKTHAGKLIRPCIKSGSTFTLQLLSKREFDPSLLDTIKLFGLVGSLGSKARKGYGSITLESMLITENNKEIEQYSAPSKYDDDNDRENSYKHVINSLLSPCATHVRKPQITAFYKDTKVHYLGIKTSAINTLNHYGIMMLRYRSYGRGGEINDTTKGISKNVGFASEKRFEDDHDWYKEINGWRDKDFHPKRTVFGLPHNYDSKKAKHCVAPNNKDYTRRASPLFFHIHKMGNIGKYIGIALIMKSQFLPNNEKIKAGDKSVEQKADYDLLTQFITGHIRNKPNIDSKEHYFPDHEQIHLQAEEDKT